MNLKSIIRKATETSDVHYVATVIFCILILLFNYSLIYEWESLDNINFLNFFTDLGTFLYNITFYIAALILSISFVRRASRFTWQVRFAAYLIPAFWSYEIIAMFLDAFEGAGSDMWLYSSIFFGGLLLIVFAVLATSSYLTQIRDEAEQKDNLLSKVLRFLEVADKKVGQAKASLKFSETASGQITDMIDYGSYNPESENYIIYKGHIETINNWIGYKKKMGDIGIKEAEKTQRAMADLYNMIAELQEKEEK